MIEGLKVTVKGGEVRDLADKRADYHAERRTAYAEQVVSMEAAKVEGMAYTNGDPVRALKEKLDEHGSEEQEMRFISAHIDPKETYLLDRDALHRLGIVKKRY